MKTILLTVAILCTTFSASRSEAEDRGYFDDLFAAIEDAEKQPSPVSVLLIDKAITAVDATHAYFSGTYRPLPPSIFRAFSAEEGSVDKAVGATAAAMTAEEKSAAAMASSMGIPPSSPWAGGGEQAWIRSIPEAARVPAHWQVFREEPRSRVESIFVAWPNIFVSKNSLARSRDSWLNFYFLAKGVKSFGPSNAIFINDGTQTCVILAAGDISVYDPHGSLADCVVISAGNVTIRSASEFLTIIARGSVNFETRNTSSVVLAGEEIKSKLVDEGLLSFAKAHFLAKKIQAQNDTASSSGAYKDYHVKLLENPTPFSEVEKLIEKKEPNPEYLEQWARGQTKYWKFLETLNSSPEPVLLLTQSLNSEDEQIQDISLHLMRNVVGAIPDSALPSLASGVLRALRDKEVPNQLLAAEIVIDIVRYQAPALKSNPEIQRALSEVAQTPDRHLSWRALMALDAIGITEEAVPALELIAQNNPDPFLSGLARRLLSNEK